MKVHILTIYSEVKSIYFEVFPNLKLTWCTFEIEETPSLTD